MKIRIDEVTGTSLHIVRVSGRLDSYTNNIFEQNLDRLFEEGKVFLVFDFSELDYINSTALGTIVATHQRAILQGGVIALFGVHGKVAMIFKITKVNGELIIVDNESEAISAVQKSE